MQRGALGEADAEQTVAVRGPNGARPHEALALPPLDLEQPVEVGVGQLSMESLHVTHRSTFAATRRPSTPAVATRSG